MKKKNLLSILIVVCLILGFSACSEKSHEAYQINKFESNPYLAEVWWGDDYDSLAAMKHLNEKYNQPTEAGGCTSWHKGNFHGRNIDWMMRDYATIIIHMPRSKNVKYSSVGLLAGNPVAVKSMLDNDTSVPEKYRNVLASSIVDGINEKGVVINHNIVPYDGANYEKNGELTTTMVCRYVLDNCATAKEAIELLASKKVTQAVVKIAHDYSHFMISDPTSSYVVEWIDGKFTATEFKADGKGDYVSAKGQKAIMTNYFVGLAEQYGLGTNEFFKQHRMGAGVERTQTVDKMLETASTVEDHLNICKAVWYKPFCEGKTQWYTENAGQYGINPQTGKAYWCRPDGTDIHEMDNDDVYAAAKELFKSSVMTDYYADFKANGSTISPKNDYWYTQHSVVYDIKNLKGYLIMQEGMFSKEVIEFGLE